MAVWLSAVQERRLGRTFVGLAVATAFACSPNTSPRGGEDGDRGTGGSSALGGTGGVSGTQSGGAGTGAGAGLGSGGTTPVGGTTSTGGSAGLAQGGVGPSGGTSGAPGGAGSGTTGGATSGGSGPGGSAGTAGAAGSSGGSGGAAGPCGHPGEVFCEDFEDVTMLDSARWAIEKIGDGTAVIDGAMGHSGTKSVHVTQVGYNSFATLKGTGIFPTGSRFYLRVFMRLATPMTGGHNTYFIAGLLGTPGAPYETRVGVMNEMLMINQPSGDRGFLSNQNYYTDHLPGAVIAPNEWGCVEVFLDPPNRTIMVWLDDEPIPDLSRTDWQQETFDVVRFGFERYAGPDSQLWYDDIAVGTQKIGCR